MSPRTSSRRLRRPHAPLLNAHDGSWTVGWPGLTGETSWSRAGCSPRPLPPQKTATLPELQSFQPTPLHAISQEAFHGRLWPPPFFLCSRRQARPTRHRTCLQAFSALKILVLDKTVLSAAAPTPPTVTRAPAGGARCSAWRGCPALSCLHALESPGAQSSLETVPSRRASEQIACFCFQFLGTDFLKFPYSYISYL